MAWTHFLRIALVAARAVELLALVRDFARRGEVVGVRGMTACRSDFVSARIYIYELPAVGSQGQWRRHKPSGDKYIVVPCEEGRVGKRVG